MTYLMFSLQNFLALCHPGKAMKIENIYMYMYVDFSRTLSTNAKPCLLASQNRTKLSTTLMVQYFQNVVKKKICYFHLFFLPHDLLIETRQFLFYSRYILDRLLAFYMFILDVPNLRNLPSFGKQNYFQS